MDQTCYDQTAEAKEQLKLRTTHVRVNITARDLDIDRKRTSRTDRTNAVAAAINRVLRDGYEATFDGLSVGIIHTQDSNGASLFVPAWAQDHPNVYSEPGDGLIGRGRRYRLCETDSTPFFRGVDERVQKLHKITVAHRKTKPARVTISLPNCALRRTKSRSRSPRRSTTTISNSSSI